MTWWMVRAGDSNELIPEWLKKQVASIGWHELGDPSRFSNREYLLQEAHRIYSDSPPRSRIVGASQVWRFVHHIKKGHRVITYAKDSREYIIGTVVGEHRHDPNVIGDYYPNTIEVKWEEKRIPRDLLTQKTKNTLGYLDSILY